MALLSLSVGFMIVSGCTLSREVIFVPTTTPVRLLEEIKDVKVLIPRKDGKFITTKRTLQVGEYVLSDVKESE